MADYKPSDLFIGVVDFFSILIPGVLLTYVLREGAASLRLPVTGELEQAAAFVVVAYILGHFIYALASTLDEWLYDAWYVQQQRRSYTVGWFAYEHIDPLDVLESRWAQRRRRIGVALGRRWPLSALAERISRSRSGAGLRPSRGNAGDTITIVADEAGGRSFSRVTRVVFGGEPAPFALPQDTLIKVTVPRDHGVDHVRVQLQRDTLLDCAMHLKKQVLGDQNAIMSTFNWARDVLRIVSPVASAEIDRLEAESKFFRSLSVVLPMVALIGGIQLGSWLLGLLCLLLVLPSAWRYLFLRWKCTQAAYEAYIAVTYVRPGETVPPGPEQTE